MSRIPARDTRTSQRADDWRDDAACHNEDPEIFFASELTAEGKAAVRHAKIICWRCPVMEACGQWAITERVPFGVFGGVSESQRRAILLRRGVRLPAEDTTDEPQPRLTLQSVWTSRTEPLCDGHLAFTGYVPIRINARFYTPRQIGFELDRGRPPTGLVRRTCEVDGCVLPSHLADQQERDQRREQAAKSAAAYSPSGRLLAPCGTRSAYMRHVKRGEPIDAPCRQANTDADNRLRRTGTTKALAS